MSPGGATSSDSGVDTLSVSRLVISSVSVNARPWVTIDTHSRVNSCSWSLTRRTSSSTATSGHCTRMKDRSESSLGRVRASPQYAQSEEQLRP